jgi:uncharacterized GH25 family protein
MFRKFLPLFLVAAAGLTSSMDLIFLPKEFFLSKGDHLEVQLLGGTEFSDMKEQPYQPARTSRLILLEGGKQIDLRSIATDSTTTFSRTMAVSGLALMAMDLDVAEQTLSKEEFVSYLSQEALYDNMDTVKASPEKTFKEIRRGFLKTLVCVDKPSGSCYDEVLGQELEIILNQNPYKMQYGDDMTATVLFQGKPLKNAPVNIETRIENGKVFSSRLTSDKEGKVYFKLNRAGTWMVSLAYVVPLASTSAGYLNWRSGYTFGFRGN